MHNQEVRPQPAWDTITIAALAAFVIATRLPFVNSFASLGKDGPLYIHSLALDNTYSVPMPGNLGYVLLGKAAHFVIADPVHAYLAVNILLTLIGVGFSYLFATLVVPRPLAAATSLALACCPMIWWHGAIIASYPVWLATMPAIAWFGIRFVRARHTCDLYGATISLGIGMILRPDLIAFGSPLWFGCLALGRARWRHWLSAITILAACCAIWFFGTAAILGGVSVYLDQVRSKHDWDTETFSLKRRGLFEGLLRNAAKYTLFLAWASLLYLIPFAREFLHRALAPLSTWRGTLLALLWVGPSWYFSFLVFAGNAGLIFPFLPLLYTGAAHGLQISLGRANLARPVTIMLMLAALSATQFLATPLLSETNQRDVILNVTFFRYAAPALKRRYNHNIEDYGISPSLASVLKQMRKPDSVPWTPHPN